MTAIRETKPERSADIIAREYRIDVLATWKALAWLVFPIVFAIVAPTNVGERIAHWFQRGFLQHISWGFTPLFWATVAEIVATVVYSTVIKWAWDAWDRDVKYPKRDAATGKWTA